MIRGRNPSATAGVAACRPAGCRGHPGDCRRLDTTCGRPWPAEAWSLGGKVHQKLLDSLMAFQTVPIQQAEENEIRLCVDVKVVTILKQKKLLIAMMGRNALQ